MQRCVCACACVTLGGVNFLLGKKKRIKKREKKKSQKQKTNPFAVIPVDQNVFLSHPERR